MRVELALIVGILFFCCWCAYIMVKMNASVALAPNEPSQTSSQGGYLANGAQVSSYATNSSNEAAIYAHPNRPTNQARQLTSQTFVSQHQNHLPRHPEANSPVPIFYAPEQQESHKQQQQQQQQQINLRPPYSTWTGNPSQASNWLAQDHGLSEQGLRQQQTLWQPANGHNLSSFRGQQSLYHEPAAPQVNGAYLHHYQQQAPFLNQLRDPDSNELVDEEQEESEPNGAGDDYRTEPPAANEDEDPAQNELEEAAGRRSFSEDQVNETERDKDGHLVLDHRKHLINGRPVNEGRRANNGDVGGEEKRADRFNATEFDSIVNEMEQAKLAEPNANIEDDEDEDEDVEQGGEGGKNVKGEEEEEENGGKIMDPQPTAASSAESRRLGIRIKPPEVRQRQIGALYLDPIRSRQGANWIGAPKSVAEPVQTTGRQVHFRPAINSPAKGHKTGPRELEGGAEPEGAEEEQLDEVGENSGELEPKKRHDLHEHKLRESLRAQQWDDDAARAPTKPPSGGAKNYKQPRGQSSAASPSQVEPPVPEADNENENASDNDANNEEEEENEKIEFDDLDTFTDSRKFPFMDSTNRRRRKRQAADSTPSNLSSLRSMIEPENLLARQDHDPDLLGDRFAGIGRELRNSSWQPLANVDSGGTITPGEGETRENSSSLVAPISANGSNLSDPVSTQEDMSIEMVASPPGTQTVVSAGQQFVGPPNYAAAPSAFPSAGHYYYQRGEPNQVANASGIGLAIGRRPYLAGRAPANQQLASGSWSQPTRARKKSIKKRKKKKRRRKLKASKVFDEKHKAAKAREYKKRSRLKKGGMKKKKRKNEKKFAKSYKEFKGSTKGKKGAKGVGEKGAKKGELYYKDKGYKKRGFKKAYQKVESGDHKTYFDEFRDKDHNKRWKDFKDKHHYSQSKNWGGKDRKKFKDLHLKELKRRKSGEGAWKEKSASKYEKDYRHKGGHYLKKKKKKKEEEEK